MNDRSLIKLSLTTSIISLLFLFLLFNNQELDITEYHLAEEGDTTRINGKVINLRFEKDYTGASIKYCDEINIFISQNVSSEVILNPDLEIEVIGEIQEYYGKKEIIAEKISVIN